MKFTNKIHAIKALREMFYHTFKVKTNPEAIGGLEVTQNYISLKEAKDFVEAVMELGIPMNGVYELTRISVMDGAVQITPVRIGLFRTEQDAMNVRDNIMRIKNYNQVYETNYDFLITFVAFGQH